MRTRTRRPLLALCLIVAPACRARRATPRAVVTARADGGPGAAANPADPPVGERLVLSDDEWRRRLAPDQYQVMREQGTERPFTGAYWDSHERGVYLCAACRAPLFSSEAKFDSGTGWPSFWEPVAPGRVERGPDGWLGLRDNEVHCARCGGHLGHVFDDGPPPTGLRYCIDSVSLELRAAQ
jgi:peptide-methionine (R)-S-oxide reductase